MRLSAQSIRRLCVDGAQPLITPFSERRLVIGGKSAGLSAASYDCRIAHDLTLGVNPALLWEQSIREEWPMERTREAVRANPPHMALAYTMEDFHIPDNVSASVADKSTYARLFVSAFNTFFDPGFHGNATLELVNSGPEPVRLKHGDPVCQFVFDWLDWPTDRPYAGKYQGQTKGAHAARFEKA